MKLHKRTQALIILVLGASLAQPYDEETHDPCKTYKPPSEGEVFDDLILEASSLHIDEKTLSAMKEKSRVCLPEPCDKLKAYSGFIAVDDYQYLFFLHIKSKENSEKKPLLLWLQGGPGKSSLYGQFLENGPLGIDASMKPYYRHHTLLNEFNVIYLDQPVGAGYSFGKYYPGSLEEATIHIMHFLTRFLRVFHEYNGRDFYVAGESYGARFAVGVAQKILTKYDEDLKLKVAGVILGVGFVFPLVEIINSADYLLYTALLDEMGYKKFTGTFGIVQQFVEKGDFKAAAFTLSKTVLNLRMPGAEKSLFEKLTGFDLHASIAYAKRPREFYPYFAYANSSDFKKRIHVSSSSSLDGKRINLATNLSVYDFFKDIKEMVQGVLETYPVLFYTAQFDDVFPAVNLENQLRKLSWKHSEMYKKACRVPWRHNDNSSGKLRGYEKKVPGLLSATVLFGGHYIYQDQSQAVSELYFRFLKSPPASDADAGSADNGECYMMKTANT